MQTATSEDLLSQIKDLKTRLSEAYEAIDAIKSGSVDAFAMKKNGKPEVFTLQSLDYAYRVLIEKFSEGALNLTREGLIIYSNSYFSGLIGIPNEKVTGSYIFDFIAADTREKFREHFSMALQGSSKTEITLSANDINIPVYISLSSLLPQLHAGRRQRAGRKDQRVFGTHVPAHQRRPEFFPDRSFGKPVCPNRPGRDPGQCLKRFRFADPRKKCHHQKRPVARH
jgi:hypothetical protein